MATIFEKATSRDQVRAVDDTTSTTDLLYGVEGTEDDAEVRALAEGMIPAFYNGLPFKNYKISTVGAGCWDVVAHYDVKQPKEKGSKTFNFDTTGGTQKLSQSISSLTYDEDGPDDSYAFGEPINVNGDKVDGVDVIIPKFAFTVVRILDAPIGPTYIQKLFEYTGKVNSDPISLTVDDLVLNFGAGELLFEGATGSRRASDDWEITLKCAASRNATGIKIGDIEEITKGGWEYLSVGFATNVGESPPRLVQKPTYVDVHKVYELANLNDLFE